MPFERIGLGGVITLRADPAVTALGRVKRATASVRASFSQLNVSMGKLGTGLRSATMAALPLAYGMLRAAKSAANFEQAVADLGAVSGASAADLARLSAKAKEMGIVTAFSASESASAMEQLARAGATVEEQISGVRGVLDLAAAGNIHYAESSSIVARITRSMGREFRTSSDLADILALAAARSNVTVSSLGESFRYGAPQARTMGISTEELTAIFGKLGDAGLDASTGGTALTAMLVKLGKPSKEAVRLMEMWKIKLTDATGALKPMPDIIEQFKRGIEAETDAVKRAAMMTELFSVRGQKAYSALATAGGESLRKLHTELKRASGGLGAATTMAEARLDTLRGSFKMLAASVEGLSIAMFEEVNVGVKKNVQSMTAGLNSVLYVMADLRKAQKEGADVERTAEMLSKKHGETALAVARGVMDAIEGMKVGWVAFTGWVREAAGWLRQELGTEGLRKLSGLVIKVFMLAAAFVPVAAVLGGVVFVLKSVLWPVLTGVIGSMWGLFAATAKLALGPMVWLGKSMTWVAVKAGKFRMIPMLKVMWFWMRKSGTGITGKFIPALLGIGRALKVVLAVGGPLFLVFGLLVSYIASIKREGEGMGDTLRRVFGGIVSTVGGFVRGFISEFGRIWSAVKRVVSAIGRMFDELFGWLWSDSKKTAGAVSGDAYSMGASFADVIEGIVTGLARMFETARGIFHEMSNFFFETAKFMDIQWAKGLRAKGIITQKEYEKELRMAAGAGRMRAEEDRKWYAESRKHAERAAEMRRKAAEATKAEAARRPPTKPPKVTVTLPPTPPPEFTVETTLDVDGSAVAKAVTRHTAEVMERSGARAVRWQRRVALEFGAIELSPAKAGGAV